MINPDYGVSDDLLKGNSRFVGVGRNLGRESISTCGSCELRL